MGLTLAFREQARQIVDRVLRRNSSPLRSFRTLSGFKQGKRDRVFELVRRSTDINEIRVFRETDNWRTHNWHTSSEIVKELQGHAVQVLWIRTVVGHETYVQPIEYGQ